MTSQGKLFLQVSEKLCHFAATLIPTLLGGVISQFLNIFT